MNAARRFGLLLALVATTLALPSSATAAPPPAPPDPACSPGPSDCGAWHNTDVTVHWSAPPPGVAVSGCDAVTISSDTSGAPVSCTWSNADGSRTTTAVVRRDATPPSVEVRPERGPEPGGWYNRPLRVEFSGGDNASGLAACSEAVTYGGPDAANASVSGSCRDNAGNTRTASHEFRYDATAPTVEARADRRPNAKGWYNRSVTVAFHGADAVSGIDGCTSPITYKGPDTPNTAVTGTCRDKATNTSSPAAYPLRYDTRPPLLGRVKAEIGARGIALRWSASKDTSSVVVVRRPGFRGKKPSTVYSGRARAFTDRRLRSGIKYRYTVSAYDEAGNAAVKGLAARYTGATVNRPAQRPDTSRPAQKPTRATPALVSPAAGARLRRPPLLSWTTVRGATYYNVQLFRGGRKILSAWPSGPSFVLQRSWQFQGRRYRLTPGTYRWYVWPGFGPRRANRYGKLVGTRAFVVRG